MRIHTAKFSAETGIGVSLSGKYWPVHPKPLVDELFSSWLIRIAQGNAIKLQTFCHLNWPGIQIWTRDIDKHGYQNLIPRLSKKTGTSEAEALSTTLNHFTGLVFEHLAWKTRARWILPLGIYHRTRNCRGIQWCSHCLSTDHKPYFRKHWRLAIASCCPKHGVLLTHECHVCMNPAAPHRGEFMKCHNCGTNYADAPSQNARARAIQLEANLLSIAKTGHSMLEPYQNIHSIAYFDIIYRLLSLLAFGARSNALRGAIARQFGGDPSPVELLQKGHLVELLSPVDRNKIMDLMAAILPGWPFRFVGVCIESSNWASWVLRDMKPTRFHLWEPAKRYLAGPLS